MFLLYIILSSVSFLLLGNIRQSVYGKTVLSVSDAYRKERHLSNVLNWFIRHYDKIEQQEIKPKLEEDIKSKSRKQNAEERKKGFAIIRMMRYLLGDNFAQSIELWNPKDKRKKRLLGTKQLKALKIGKETKHRKGGISPFQLAQIAYAIGERYTKKHGNGWTVEEIDHSELFEIAEKYHAEKEAERKKRKQNRSSEKEEKTTDSEKVVTVEEYLNGNIKLSKVENVELLKQFHEDERVTKGKKSAVTRRINELENS